MQNKNLQNRREFFKEAAKMSLPMLSFALFASTPMLTSCVKDPVPTTCGGNCTGNCSTDCSSSCGNTCSSGCGSDCAEICSRSCGESCSNDCSTECANTCSNDCDTECANTCSNDCSTECANTCSNDCSTECANTCSNTCTNSANNSQNGSISEPSGSVDGHDYVDLGLSVMWARCNVNASRPQDFGIYTDIRYNSLTTQEQINLLLSYGLIYDYDNPQIKELGGISDFDVATQSWGDSWRMPSQSEWIELRDNCDFDAYELGGVSGVKATSRVNGNSIFIPLSGIYINNSGLSSVGSMVDFHCSTFQVRAYYVSRVSTYRFSKRASGEIQFNNYGSSPRPFTRAVTIGSGGSPTNCNGNCTNTATNSCSSCQIGCSSNCTSQCSSGCSSGCKTTCSGTCPNGCSTLCGGACKSSCGGTCSYVSSGSSCTAGTCATSCYNYCYHSCSLACSESCMSCCITSSK